MELTARIHIEEGSYWADVPELPGCFASGDTLDELFESLREGVALYLADEGEESGRERAERLLADRTSFQVGVDAWQEIVAAMDRPAQARPELVELFSRPRPE